MQKETLRIMHSYCYSTAAFDGIGSLAFRPPFMQVQGTRDPLIRREVVLQVCRQPTTMTETLNKTCLDSFRQKLTGLIFSSFFELLNHRAN